MRNFFRVMLACKDMIFENKDRPAADVFLKIRYFVEDGSYSSCKRARTIAEMRLRGCDAHLIADHFDVSYDTIRTEIKKMSNELWGIFPEDFFDRLVDYQDNKGYIQEVVNALKFYNKRAEDMLLADVVRDVRNDKTLDEEVEYSIADCRDEIDFLLRYSKEFYKKDLLTIDRNKLRYLIRILDGRGTIIQKAELSSKLGGFGND